MFEAIVVRRISNYGHPIDAGLIAEALLFYQNVHLLLERGSLASLLNTIGPDNLLYLVNNKFATITYLQDSLGTHTDSTRGPSVHRFIAYQFVGTKEKGRLTKEENIIEIFERTLGKSWNTRKVAKKFVRNIPVRTIEKLLGAPSTIPDLAAKDLEDPIYVRQAIEILLAQLVPEIDLPAGWRFSPIKVEDGFFVDTDLDFDLINSEYHKSVPPTHSTISPEFLLNYIQDARADISFSSHYLSEFVAAPESCLIMQLKFANLLEKRFKNAKDIELFQEIHLDNARAIRDAINEGDRSFSDFLKVLEKASKFKEWLQDAHPDERLLSEYYKAATAGTWVDRIRAKTARFALCTGAGMLVDALAGPGVGVGVGAADAFVVGRFLKGWRPSQFIEGPLKEFVDTK